GLHTPPGKSLPVRVVCASRGEGLHPRCRGSGVGNEREGLAALRSRAPHLSCLHHLVHQPKQGGGGHAEADAGRGKGPEVSRRLPKGLGPRRRRDTWNSSAASRRLKGRHSVKG